MNNQLVTPVTPGVFQKWIDDPKTKLPLTISRILTPIVPELGKLTVVHPSDNDPALVSEKYGTVAIWFEF